MWSPTRVFPQELFFLREDDDFTPFNTGALLLLLVLLLVRDPEDEIVFPRDDKAIITPSLGATGSGDTDFLELVMEVDDDDGVGSTAAGSK